MIRFKNNFPLSKKDLSDLSDCIGKSLNGILSTRIQCVFDSNDNLEFYLDDVHLKIGDGCLLSMFNAFRYDRILRDDIQYFSLRFQENAQMQLYGPYLNGISFNGIEWKILNIKVYGQERERSWNDDYKYSFFGKDFSVEQEVTDSLFTPEIFILEGKNTEQLVIWSDRNSFYVTKEVNSFREQYYTWDEINPIYSEKHPEKSSMPSNVLKYKLLYEIN